MKAEALAGLGREDEAIRVYDELFAGDFADDDVLLDYLNLLIDAEKQVKALMVIEREAAERPSRKLRFWEGRVAVLAEDFRRAETAFRGIGESEGWDGRLFGEMVDLFQAEGNHEAAWEWLDKQEQQMGATYEVWMGRGRSQLATGKLLEAHVSFSQAAEQRPGDVDAAGYLDEVARKIRLEESEREGR